jgi:hypothetical protein
MKGEPGVELNGLLLSAMGSAKKSVTSGSVKSELDKSASLWKGSVSIHAFRLIGVRMLDPHLIRSFPGKSFGRKACGWKKLKFPRLRQSIYLKIVYNIFLYFLKN